MNRKKTASIVTLGTAAILLGMAWLSQGCVMEGECICSTDFQSWTAFIVDEASQPVDSAAIQLFRVADSMALPAPDQNHAYPREGRAVIFTDGYSKYYPKGKKEMEIRVVATKNGKTGEARYVVGEDDCGCHFRIVSGPETITIR